MVKKENQRGWERQKENGLFFHHLHSSGAGKSWGRGESFGLAYYECGLANKSWSQKEKQKRKKL